MTSPAPTDGQTGLDDVPTSQDEMGGKRHVRGHFRYVRPAGSQCAIEENLDGSFGLVHPGLFLAHTRPPEPATP
jgi:hypothetical protein